MLLFFFLHPGKGAAGVEAQVQITTEVEARIARKAGTAVRAAAARKNDLAAKNAAAHAVMSVMDAIAVARAPSEYSSSQCGITFATL